MQFSLLQRFRRGADLKAVDRYKPKYENKEQQEEAKGRENEWYRENVLTEEQKALETKNKVEKGRYIKALKELIREKGSKLNPHSEEMPALCSCGALMENIRQLQSKSDNFSATSTLQSRYGTITSSKSTMTRVSGLGSSMDNF